MRNDAAPPVYSVLLISAAALAYEVLLMRLFSIIQWHHFAYMMISLALLGYGVSGTFLTFLGHRLKPHFSVAFVANAVLFGISSIICFLLAQQLPFNTLEMFWEPNQWRLLLLSYLLLFIPFFFAANAICLTFARFGEQIPRIYAFDLLGAGLGSAGIILALYYLAPADTLKLVAAIGLLAAALARLEGEKPHNWQITFALSSLVLVTLLLPNHWLRLQLSEYKSLSQTLRIPGTSILEEHSSPLGLITLVDSPRVPLRLAPGLSLNNTQEPPAQLGVFIDGDAPTPLNRFDGDLQPFAYLDYQTSALPYHLMNPGQVLILGMGGGSGLLQAAYHDIARIEAVELIPQLVELFQHGYADYTGWQWLRDRTLIHEEEARGFISSSHKRYDLIQISLLDSASASSGGVYGLSESYLYTREAIAEYLQQLNPNGLLAITRWVKLPPRDGLKLFATSIEALRHNGVQSPDQQIMLIRAWDTSTLVIKNGRISNQEIQRLHGFCEARSFDLAYFPNITKQQTNRYNILSEPYFYQGAMALLGDEAERFLEQYKFDIQPATDNRPYFFNYFKWSTLPEIIATYRQGGFSLLELGYPILILTLLQAMVASAVLILLPIGFIRRQSNTTGSGNAAQVLLYFLSIGLGFLFIEIAFMQKFILFLAHPIHAIAVTLCGFLIFSGLGSLYAQNLVKQNDGMRLHLIVGVLAGLAVVYTWLMPVMFAGLADLPILFKAIATLVMIAPLAFTMGMPFPLGLSRLARQSPHLVPWAWGVNGCASLISAILASLLAIHFGFTWVILIAILTYLTAAVIYPSLSHQPPA
ncbi:MAG: SAM-dependent methyltransferase [Pseudomonadota bacterium]